MSLTLEAAEAAFAKASETRAALVVEETEFVNTMRERKRESSDEYRRWERAVALLGQLERDEIERDEATMLLARLGLTLEG
jgi:hypothetical protein